MFIIKFLVLFKVLIEVRPSETMEFEKFIKMGKELELTGEKLHQFAREMEAKEAEIAMEKQREERDE